MARPVVARTLSALHRARADLTKRNATIALVPTMGALHDGHISLVRLARRRAKKVVVSIFVNPQQFAPHEDFGSYPRTVKEDIARLAVEGVDLVWNPDVKTMYPEGFATAIVPEGPATAGLEDRFRPHFFGGVAIVVAKLLLQVRPDVAIFGEKDYQQLKVVTRMARDLDLGTKIVGAPLIRERDGLAMSSRNVYLSADERRAAPTLFRSMKETAKRIRAIDRPRRIRSRLSRGPACRDAGADRKPQGRSGPHAGRRPHRIDAPDRQHPGLKTLYSRPSSRSSRRIGSGILAMLAAALPRSGGALLSSR